MQPLRDYQQRSLAGIRREWQAHRAVCYVLPTAGGKTRVAEEVIAGEAGPVVFVVHRTELVRQTADRLTQRFGSATVSAGTSGARIQVATIQTLVARGERPPADLVVFDECHHYRAEQWGAVADDYSSARFLGLTATPERQDGKPLGDMFDSLVVGATYSELLNAGHLVDCDVYQPPKHMGSDLALDPIKAYHRYTPDALAFLFAGSVSLAEEFAERFRASGVEAATVTATTPGDERAQTMRDFEAGRIRVLSNVYTMTEGVDVPAAEAVILARGCRHVGMYLQIVGRILRPHPGKVRATCIDLTGATLRHGMPTEDREYSLSGEGITRTATQTIRQCPQCGACHATAPACPQCGFIYPIHKQRQPRIWDLELRAVYAGEDTPETAKRRELGRLRDVQREKGFTLFFVVKAYRELFREDPILTDATPREKHNELRRLNKIASARGFKRGYAAVNFKRLFGHWPDRNMRSW